ncbi:probable 3-deoxy-D-manno-octulosonic acid transferase, mitochondrial isoform X2 [Daucus carota subsp. sativus]|uniref:probable 3-deoxy-D-manno-octulosonic acid transferase, mitochondrial isoform X2 n=1 Tax=Daucus carota subsp. sativus TaxID=79200 RepID=UPI0007EF5168|nr:PREDICTED: probable 3-deoxy-D-manno-octulosonic acid transferase, mitochondrial isoform X2 [Daucus carota subsp. sativus]
MGRHRAGYLVYTLYRSLSHCLSPLIHLHLRFRRFRGIEHPLRWRERLGLPSLPRPPGPLFWFHAVSLGEGLAALPVIKRCVQRRPDVTVLLTTTTLSAFEVLKHLLPSEVIYQFTPVDTPVAIDSFLAYWKPNALLLVESELWPNLVMSAARNGITLAILNARMSPKSFRNWSLPAVLQMMNLMLSKFSLIIPLAVHFQILQAPPLSICFAGDLKFAVEDSLSYNPDIAILEDLKLQIDDRPVWMASSIHKGEEKVIVDVHKRLKNIHSDIITIIVPRRPQLGRDITREWKKDGVSVALRSNHDKLLPETDIYMVDTLGELRSFYRITPIALIGGSLLPGLSGHNISEAAAAGCAVLTGHHVGHFLNMVSEMQRINPLSVHQVAGNIELCEVLTELFSNCIALEARRAAGKQAYHALSNGVGESVWNLLNCHVFGKALEET